LTNKNRKHKKVQAARDKAGKKRKREADDEQVNKRSKLEHEFIPEKYNSVGAGKICFRNREYDCDEAMVQGTLVSAQRVPSNVLTPLSPMAKQDFIRTESPHASTQSRGTNVVHVNIMAVQKRFDKVLYVESAIRLGAFQTALRVKRQTRGVWRRTVAIQCFLVGIRLSFLRVHRRGFGEHKVS